MWSRLNRLRHLDNSFLHHTEWSRQLGSVGIAAFLGSVGFPMGIFLLIPYCAKEIAGPSTSLSVLIVFVSTILTGLHLVEMCGRIPKSGCTYTFVYVTFGELWAFLCAWSTVFDYCAMAAVLAKGWSSHLDYMFHGNLKKYMSPSMLDNQKVHFNNITDNATTDNYANQILSTASGFFENSDIFEERLDALATVGLAVAAVVALFGISVVSTVCMALMIVGALIVSSSILVGLFYANVSTWSQHGYFIASFEGVCKAASYLLRPMIGLEIVGSLVEETTNPQNRLAILLPLMNCVLFFYFFLMSIIVTLVIPYYQIPLDASLPSIYGLISVPASRYVLSVGSVCALSGALLSSLLPPVRYLHALSLDGLLCGICKRFAPVLKSTPLASFAASLLLTAGLVLVKSPVLLSILRIFLPARFMILTAATLLQRYRDTPTGLLAEVANYKAMQFKSKSISSFFSGAGTSVGGASATDGSFLSGGAFNGRRSSIASRNTSDRYSVSSSFIMRNIAAAQYELGREEEDDEEEEDDFHEVLFEPKEKSKKRRRRQRKHLLTDSGDEMEKFETNRGTSLDDDEVTIFSRGVQPMPVSKSVTGELSALLMRQQQQHGSARGNGTTAADSVAAGGKMKKSATSVSFQSVNLNDQPHPQHQRHHWKRRSVTSHNCIRSPCTPSSNLDPFYHLYQREVPEGMPYCDTFSMYAPSSTAVNQCIVYRKAKLWLAFCLSAHLACAICIVRGWHQLESGIWWMYLMSTLSFGAAITGTIALGWLPQNVDNGVRHQVPASPYLALLNTFILSLMLASADFAGVWKSALVLATGFVVYATYGYRHSVEHQRSLNIAPQTLTAETDENTGLVAPLAAYQVSETASKSSLNNVKPFPQLSSKSVNENGSC